VSKIDPSYTLSKHRIDLDQETRLSATAEDVAYWLAPADAKLREAYEARCAEAGTPPEPPGAAPLAVSASFGTSSEYSNPNPNPNPNPKPNPIPNPNPNPNPNPITI